MHRLIAYVVISLACAVLIGVIGTAYAGATATSLLPGASDMMDDLLVLPVMCLLLVVGPIAAGAAASRLALAVAARIGTSTAGDRARLRREALAAGALAIPLSWILIIQGSIYSVFDLLAP